MKPIGFICHACDTEFTIPVDYLLQKDKVICPSCGSELSGEVLENLKDCIGSYSKACSAARNDERERDYLSFQMPWQD